MAMNICKISTCFGCFMPGLGKQLSFSVVFLTTFCLVEVGPSNKSTVEENSLRPSLNHGYPWIMIPQIGIREDWGSYHPDFVRPIRPYLQISCHRFLTAQWRWSYSISPDRTTDHCSYMTSIRILKESLWNKWMDS